MSDKKKYKVLFLCTGNTARSVMGELLMERLGGGRFKTYSAGSHPKGVVNPYTIRVLEEEHEIDAGSANSESWEVYKDVDFDFVITVCGHAKESCPVWPADTIVAHWGSEDPAAVEGSEEEIMKVFREVSWQIRRRVELFAALPFDELDQAGLEERTKEIGSKP
ncbi:MAG: arsenate reductase ArsC [Verrucomicrobiota bacterium]